jgi:hypothetical protein
MDLPTDCWRLIFQYVDIEQQSRWALISRCAAAAITYNTHIQELQIYFAMHPSGSSKHALVTAARKAPYSVLRYALIKYNKHFHIANSKYTKIINKILCALAIRADVALLDLYFELFLEEILRIVNLWQRFGDNKSLLIRVDTPTVNLLASQKKITIITWLLDHHLCNWNITTTWLNTIDRQFRTIEYKIVFHISSRTARKLMYSHIDQTRASFGMWRHTLTNRNVPHTLQSSMTNINELFAFMFYMYGNNGLLLYQQLSASEFDKIITTSPNDIVYQILQYFRQVKAI